MNRINLFCIAYAGGSARAIYSKWKEKLDPMINVYCLELPGHGQRMHEAFHRSVKTAVAEMLETIRPLINEEPYALYGHSMGTVLVYELAAAIRAEGLPQPQTIFVSGRLPPHHRYENEKVHLLSDDMFLDYVKRIGGTPPQFFESKELLKVFIPILRNDYRIIEEYKFQEPAICFHADLVFFYSNQDFYVEKPGIMEWGRYTNKAFKVYDFLGGHFFINEVWQDLCKIINQELLGNRCNSHS